MSVAKGFWQFIENWLGSIFGSVFQTNATGRDIALDAMSDENTTEPVLNKLPKSFCNTHNSFILWYLSIRNRISSLLRSELKEFAPFGLTLFDFNTSIIYITIYSNIFLMCPLV